MKKVISIILSVLFVFGAVAPALAAGNESCNCDNVPIIYVKGRTTMVVHKGQEISDDNPTLPLKKDFNSFYLPLIKDLLPVYYKAYKTNNFEEFTEKLCVYLDEIYGDFKLDNNGEVANDSGLTADDIWRNRPITGTHSPSGSVSTPSEASKEIYRYYFQYDCRVDPLESAKDLHEYVNAVKEATGHSRVKFLARCLGTVVMSSYFVLYGWEDVDDVVIYNPTMNGTAVTDCAFTGDLFLQPDGIEYFADQQLPELIEDGNLSALLIDIVAMANKTYGLDALSDYFNMTLPKVGTQVMPAALLECYATTPGYWAMVSSDKYDEAKALIFSGKEEEYSGLIKKLDNYHNLVGKRLSTLYSELKDDGVNVYFFAKYGSQLYPLMTESDIQSDSIITVQQQAPGTVAASVGSTLDSDYIDKIVKSGDGKYISPDKIIDASQNKFRDTTWYIKNITHNCFPAVIDQLLYEVLRSNGKMTIETDERFPQYLVYVGEEENNGDYVIPMTEEEPGETVQTKSFFEYFVDFFKRIFELIKAQIFKTDTAA